MSFSLLVQRGKSTISKRLSKMSFSLLVQLRKYEKTIKRLSEMSFSLLVQLGKYENH